MPATPKRRFSASSFPRRLRLLYGALPVLGGGLALLGGCSAPLGLSSPSQQQQQAQSTENLQAQGNQQPPSPAEVRSNFVTEVANQASPAVVQINTAKTVKTEVPEVFENPFFRRFFGDEVPVPREKVKRGMGSGFVLDSNGRILTNAHVVSNADKVMVTFKDGRTLDGQVLGADPLTDVAVVKVNANDLPTLEMGDSQSVQPGQWAIAIGNPFGLEESVTLGVISATGRSSSEIGVPDKRVNFLQTDAPINPGNSGGPLLNARGEVVGINTAILGKGQGLGFAVPINAAQQVAQEIIETGEVQYPYVGIRMVTLTPEVKQRLNQDPRRDLNIQAEEGVLVVEVMQGSPAAQAGLQPGDIIQSVGSQTVTESSQVQKIVESREIGSQLSMRVQRNGQSETISVQLEKLPVKSLKRQQQRRRR